QSFSLTVTTPPEIYTLSLHDALPIWYKSNDYDPVNQNAKEELSTTSNNNTRDINTLSGNPTRTPYKEIIDYPNEKTGRKYKHTRSEEHTSELQSRFDLVCRLLLEKKK